MTKKEITDILDRYYKSRDSFLPTYEYRNSIAYVSEIPNINRPAYIHLNELGRGNVYVPEQGMRVRIL